MLLVMPCYPLLSGGIIAKQSCWICYFHSFANPLFPQHWNVSKTVVTELFQNIFSLVFRIHGEKSLYSMMMVLIIGTAGPGKSTFYGILYNYIQLSHWPGRIANCALNHVYNTLVKNILIYKRQCAFVLLVCLLDNYYNYHCIPEHIGENVRVRLLPCFM